jgi:prevent-host-death family protein
MVEVSVAEAKAKLSLLLTRAESGEDILITRRGQPIARLTAAPRKKKVKFGTLAGKVDLQPGWDAPMTDKEFEEFSNDDSLVG